MPFQLIEWLHKYTTEILVNKLLINFCLPFPVSLCF